MSPHPHPVPIPAEAPSAADAVVDLLRASNTSSLCAAVTAVSDDDLIALFERLDPRHRRGEDIRQRIVIRRCSPGPAAVCGDLGEVEEAHTDPVTGQRPPDSVSRIAATSPETFEDVVEVER